MTAENNEVVSVLRELSSKFDSLRQDVDRLKERSVVDDTERRLRSRSPSTRSLSRSRQERRDPSPSRSRSRSGRRERQRPRRRRESADSENWGRRMERLSEEEDCLGPIPNFLDSDEESDPVEVSEATAELLTERCTLGLKNDARLKARRRYPLPKVPATKTPQLDGFIKSEVTMATRNADKELARLQSLVLDSLAPLTHLLEAEQRGGPPTWEEAKKAVVAATELVSNASAKITHLRREMVTTDLNKALLPVAKEAANFQSAPPTLIVWHGVCQEGQGPRRPGQGNEGVSPHQAGHQVAFSWGPPQEGGRRQVQRQQQQARRIIPAVPEGRSSEQLQALPQGVPEARTSQELMHQPHAIPPPLVLTNIISQLKGWGVVPLKAPKAVARRLQYHLANWERVTKDRWVLDTVKGYLIEFTNDPYQRTRPHPPQYGAELMAQMRVELTELLQKGAVAQMQQAKGGFYSTLFLVPKKDGRQRPVINLKALNQYVQTYHFKMEGLQTLKDLLKPGDWLAKVDLKDAYFAIPINPSHRKYLRFVVDNPTRPTSSTVSPLAWQQHHGSSPRLTTKVSLAQVCSVKCESIVLLLS